MELIDYASIAVLLYITFTFLTRAILIGLYAYFLLEWIKDDDKPTERDSSQTSNAYNNQ